MFRYLCTLACFNIFLFISMKAQVTKEQCDAMQKAYERKEDGTMICLTGPVQDLTNFVHRPKPLKFSFCFDYESYITCDLGSEQSCNNGASSNTETEWINILSDVAKVWRSSCSLSEQQDILIDIVIAKKNPDGSFIPCQSADNRLIIVNAVNDRNQWRGRNPKSNPDTTIAATINHSFITNGEIISSQIDLNFTPNYLNNGGNFDKGARWSRNCCSPTIPQNSCMACCGLTEDNGQLVSCLSYGKILLHEVGHALGFAHTSDCTDGRSRDVMYSDDCAEKPLSDRDACTFCSMYCERCCNECPPPTDIKELTISKVGSLPEITVSPNPTKNSFKIEYSDLESNCILDIFSFNGILLTSIRLEPGQSNRQIINLAQNTFTSGVILLVLRNDVSYTTKKIILLK